MAKVLELADLVAAGRPDRVAWFHIGAALMSQERESLHLCMETEADLGIPGAILWVPSAWLHARRAVRSVFF
jgi:hypothetical protein